MLLNPTVSSTQTSTQQEEWLIKLYRIKCRSEAMRGHVGPPSPHSYFRKPASSLFALRKKNEVRLQRDINAAIAQTIQNVDQYLMSKAEHHYRLRTVPQGTTCQTEALVYQAACLISFPSQRGWQKSLEHLQQKLNNTGFWLEVSGPHPPCHFIPGLET